MSILQTVRDRIVGASIGASLGGDALERATEAMEETSVRSKEGLADLELAFDDVGWRDLTTQRWNFNPLTLRRIVALSRLMYLINPLIRRAVTVQELYVWGSGHEIKAEDPAVDQVMKDFFDDPKNQSVIGAAWPERERDQRIDGNTFFVFYLNKRNGRARVRTVPFDQIEDVISNPEDAKEPWFYRRAPAPITSDTPLNPVDGIPGMNVLLPCIHYNPKVKPPSMNGVPINWDAHVLHIKTGGLTMMKFGLPELYSAMNWATAYKKILENFATILAAYARLAMKMTGLPGAKGVAAAKSKMNTTISGTGGSIATIDRNPPTNAASWVALSGNVDVTPVKTSGSTTGPDEARALRSMVAAGSDTPEHFFGDSDVGNFATSTTLDRPTELKMVSRQRLWTFVILTMSQKLIEWSAVSPQGRLKQAGFVAAQDLDPFDGTQIVTVMPPKDGSLKVTITFPTILERDVTERVRSVVNAATLNGSKAEGIIPDRKLLFKLLMVALGEKDADYLTEKYYPKSVLQGFMDPADDAKNERLEAEGRKEVGDAALLAAKNKPPPAPPVKESDLPPKRKKRTSRIERDEFGMLKGVIQEEE